MASSKRPQRKKIDHLLAIGTIILSNEELFTFVQEIREEYNVNPVKNELNANYKEELEKSGKLAKIRDKVEAFYQKSLSEDDGEAGSLYSLVSHLTSMLATRKEAKAKDVWNDLWPMYTEAIRHIMKNMLGDLTVEEALKKHGYEYLLGDVFVEETVDFIVTDELQNFRGKYISGVIDIPDAVIAIASPLTIQDEIIREFKQAIQKKFPASHRTLNGRIDAACLGYHRMGLTDKQIALKLYDLDPDRKDFDKELSRLAQNVRKKRERIKKQLDKLM